MSDAKVQKTIDNLLKQARGSKDAESLYEIAYALRDLGAYDKQAQVIAKAKDAERKEAELVGMR